MEKTTLLDFVTKLSELATPKNSTKNSDETATPQKEEQNPPPAPPKEGENSLLKSYNPFELKTRARTQLNMPRAQKPTKDVIDLSSSKSKPSKPQSEGGKNMIELINRHNAFASRIKGGK